MTTTSFMPLAISGRFVRRGHGQEQRDHIVGAGVGVDDQVDGGGLQGSGCGHEGDSL